MVQSRSEIIQEILDELRWHWRSWDDIKNSSLFTKANYTTFFLLVGFVAFAIYQARVRQQEAQKAGPDKPWLPAPEFPEVEELPKFSWKDEEPLKLRNFKPKYHLTMGFDESALQKLDPNELILMDRNYASRMEYRQKIMKEYHDIAVAVNNDSRVGGAVQELYTWLMATYLPKRYPTMFKLHHTTFETGNMYMLENLVTKAVLPAQADKTSDTMRLLENLGRTVDDDFLLLVPEDAEEGKEADAKYVLEACVCICPSGFNPSEKAGKRLADIHTPVPGYSKYLEGSMDRYFSKISPGEYIKRSNWTVTTHGNLFAYSGGNHAYEGDKIEVQDEVDVENTFLRCERQTLHRLPTSRAVVFAFKTYLYPIKDIKDEGLGEDLAQAIDGWKEGNVPGMHYYKRGAVWGKAVKEYLKS